MRSLKQFDGFFSAAEGAAEPYRYVAFNVPLRCSHIAVSYHYNSVHGDGPCTVDIGLFDVRGTEPLTGGFRGWSGSDRRTFFLEHARATPGYVAGELPAGTWSVLLGLYEVPPSGVRWWITVELEFGAGAAEPVTAPRSTAVAATNDRPGWYRGDLHSHSEHSDGANTIAELAAFAASSGLDFLAITDHNTTTHHAEMASLESPVLLVPGEEITTYKGHANVWGVREWVDFRVTNDEEVQRLLRWVEARGRPVSMNHPKSVGPPWLLADPGFAIREVWQAPWRWYNWQSMHDWDQELLAGRRIVPVGGSDAHWVPPAAQRHPNTVGEPTTWVYCDGGLSEQGVLDAITAGRTAISDSPSGPRLFLEDDGDEGVTARYAGAGGSDLVVIADGEPRHRFPLPGEDGVIELPASVRFDRYLRAELRVPAPKSREDVRALSAPVYRGP